MSAAYYESIIDFCEAALEQHGDCHLGVGWTKEPETATRRYDIMLGVVREPPGEPVELLDFGCGASHLYDHLLKQPPRGIRYSGLDLSDRFLELSRRKHPAIAYYKVDVLQDASSLPSFDYMVLNGVFTCRRDVPEAAMMEYMAATLKACFGLARKGIAFNVMSKLVDWERDDLFHVPFDALAQLVAAHLSRDFIIRHDYGLYEYTTYVYR